MVLLHRCARESFERAAGAFPCENSITGLRNAHTVMEDAQVPWWRDWAAVAA
jgi:hypothetical protein